MARATRLRVLASTPATAADADQLVEDAFPSALPPPVDPHSQHADDVLAMLRRDTDRALSIATHADTNALTALGNAAQAGLAAEQATGAAESALSSTAALVTRTSAVEAQADEIGRRTMAAIAEHATAKGQARVAVASAANQIVALLVQITVYALDRLPMLLTLAAAVWLWQRVLDDPTVLRLVGLGLFGGLVIAPALWLSARVRGKS